MAKLFTSDRETGTRIEEVSSVEEGKALIAGYEDEDKANGTYEPDFYDVVNFDGISVL